MNFEYLLLHNSHLCDPLEKVNNGFRLEVENVFTSNQS